MNPVDVILWGAAIGAALAAALGAFVFVCELFGIEWPDESGEEPKKR